MGNKDDGEHRSRKLRDAAAVLSVVGPAILVAGLVGTWHLIQYRMGKVEESLRRAESLLEDLRFDQIRKSSRIEGIEERLRFCCIRRGATIEADK